MDLISSPSFKCVMACCLKSSLVLTPRKASPMKDGTKMISSMETVSREDKLPYRIFVVMFPCSEKPIVYPRFIVL
jgi:hypothetical protein